MENRKKILYFITKGNWGGAQKYVFDLATSVRNESFSAEVAIGSYGDELGERLKKEGIPVIKLSNLSNSLNPFTLFFSVLENIKLIKIEKPYLVHTNSSFAGLSIGIACFILRQKCIFTAHGWPFNEDRNKFQKIILNFFMGLVIFFHNKTICVSRATLYQVPKLLGFIDQHKKCVLIYNGLDEKDIVFENFSKIKVLDRNIINIVTIAELHPTKNYPLILNALSDLPPNLNWNYHIIGEGAGRQKIENIIKEHKYKNKIFMYGKVIDAKKYLKDFDIFAIGSITEAFCYVLLEAGLARLPCVATNVGGIKEILDNGINGFLVESGNINSFSYNLKKLIEGQIFET